MKEYKNIKLKQSFDTFNPDVKKVVQQAIWDNPELEEMKKTFKALAKK